MTEEQSHQEPATEAKKDAKVRSLRTLGQTAIGAVPAGALIIVGTVLTDTLSAGEVVTVAALIQALVPPLAAYAWRRIEK